MSVTSTSDNSTITLLNYRHNLCKGIW